MSKADFTANSKPEKPYPEFPLFPHDNGQWAKKIKGKLHYFGPWANSQAAHALYLKEKDDLEAGRKPKRHDTSADTLTVGGMVELYLDARKLHVESGELAARTWREYKSFGERMIRVFGENTPVESLGPDDFQKLRADFQKTHKSLRSLLGDIRKTKVFFNWAGPGPEAQGYFEKMPRFGPAFKAPSRTALDRERVEKGEKAVFTAEELRAVLAVAGRNIKAMILLGVNCGYGNMDCVKVTIPYLDLDGGWANFPRTKNATPRRNPLWPETVDALREVLKARKTPADLTHRDRVFITKWGRAYKARNLSREIGNVLERAGFDRTNADFYDLRRTCASIGVQVNDDDAVRMIMGHKRPGGDMLGEYNRLAVVDDRIRRASDYIRDWLFKGSEAPPSFSEFGDDGQPDDPSEPVVLRLFAG